MRKECRRILSVGLFVMICIMLGAPSCSGNVTPTSFTVSIHNNNGAGISITVRLGPSSSDYQSFGPFANGWIGSFTVDPNTTIRIWDNNGGAFLHFTVSTTIHTIVEDLVIDIEPGTPPVLVLSHP